MNNITTEHVNDICGGYYIAHYGNLHVVVEAGETPVEAINRAIEEGKE